MGVALKDLRGKVKRPVRSVSICLDGELWAKHDELTAQLDQMQQQFSAKMRDASASKDLAEQIETLEQQMRDSQVTVEFRGISNYKLTEIQARFPAKNNKMAWDMNEGAAALIAACAVEPITEDEARELLDEVSQTVADQLFTAAWAATVGSSEIPFSARASELLHGNV